MHVWLDRVPLRDSSLAPEEILMSESQERMMAVVTPDKLDAFMAITTTWDVEATVVGEVTSTGRLVVQWHGDTVVDVPPRTVAHDGPVYSRPMARPAGLEALQADAPTSQRLVRPGTGDELRATLLRLVSSPNLCSKSWVTDQYDRYVQGNTALAMPDDAGVVRVDESTGLGVALSTDCNARFAALDPYAGAQLALAEAYRNVATVGAKPLAVTDCLNFGSPEDPEVMWQFSQAVTGLADGCQALGVPVTGGNVSLYNSTGDVAIHPTPVVGVLGVLDDVTRRTPSGWRTAGQAIFLIGATRDELAGSSWADVEHGHLGGLPPAVDLDAERVLAEILVACSRDGLVDAAHDLSDGGLAVALVESCLRYGVGARIWLDELCERDGIDPFVALFSESTARVLVAVPRSEEVRFTDMCTARHVPHQRIGVVDDAAATASASGFPGASRGGGSPVRPGPASDDGQVLDVQDLFALPLTELRAAHEATLPAAFDA
jgi:phosphoribosylformylglycinamidine synthase